MTILLALLRKEFYQIIRDPSSILIAFILPAILLPIYMYGINLDTTRLDLGLKIEDPSPEAESLADAFKSNPFIATRLYDRRQTMYDDLTSGRIRGFVVIPQDFSRRLEKGNAALQVIADGSETNTANYVYNYASAVSSHWLANSGKHRFDAPPPLLTAETRVWYNQPLDSHYFILPGTLAITITLVGMLLTALVIAREWERGTMEALLATRVRPLELVLSKYLAYFVLGLASVAFYVAVCILWFKIPFRGSLWVLTLTSSLFLFAALGQGLWISSFFKNQFTASQAALVGGFMPSLILSGLVFPIQSMPPVIRFLTYLIPARYYLPCAQSEFLAGTVWSIIWPNSLFMLVFGLVLFILVYRQTQTRIA